MLLNISGYVAWFLNHQGVMCGVQLEQQAHVRYTSVCFSKISGLIYSWMCMSCWQEGSLCRNIVCDYVHNPSYIKSCWGNPGCLQEKHCIAMSCILIMKAWSWYTQKLIRCGETCRILNHLQILRIMKVVTIWSLDTYIPCRCLVLEHTTAEATPLIKADFVLVSWRNTYWVWCRVMLHAEMLAVKSADMIKMWVFFW